MSVISLDKTITIALSVKDRHASADWYGTMLGFATIHHADEAGWSELQTNTTGVIIGLGEHTEPAPGNCVPVFGVADLPKLQPVQHGNEQRTKKPNNCKGGQRRNHNFKHSDIITPSPRAGQSFSAESVERRKI